jgi:hypothetical protein
MRATSPKDQIQYLGDTVELPRPKYDICTKLNVTALSAHSKRYYFRKAMYEIIADTRKVIRELRSSGYFENMVGNKLLPETKDQIRAKLDMLMTADSIEIAGCRPQGLHVTGAIANQCYLRNGQCHSGVGYEYFLLFRKNVDGNKVAYIHPYAVIREEYLKELLVPLELPAEALDQ